MHNKTILPPRGGIGPTTPPRQLTGSGGGGDLAVMGDEERGMQHTRPEKQMMTAATERGTPAAADTRTRPRPPLVATSSSRDISDKKRMYCTPRSPDGRGATAAELPPQLRGANLSAYYSPRTQISITSEVSSTSKTSLIECRRARAQAGSSAQVNCVDRMSISHACELRNCSTSFTGTDCIF